MDAPRDVIVIGAGPSGLYAAFQLGLAGARPVIIDTLPYPGGQCAALYPDAQIYDAPGHTETTAGALTRALTAQIAPFDPLWVMGRRAASVWGSVETGFSVETDTGETVTGAAILYAGGPGALRPAPLTAAGIERLRKGQVLYETEPAAAAGRDVAVLGAGPAAIALALDAAETARRVSLIHDAAFAADEALLTRLNEAAAARRLTVVEGAVEAVHDDDGRLDALSISGPYGVQRQDADLLMVQAGLEFAAEGLTGLGRVIDPLTGETETRGVFILGDATPGEGRPPVIAAGFSEALRAAQAAHARIDPAAPRTLPHTASSPALKRRLNVA